MDTRDDTPDEGEEPERYDAPNQEVVREDGSGPADEGTGGTPAEPDQPEPEPAPDPAAPEGEPSTA
jgi:hypothetical protein